MLEKRIVQYIYKCKRNRNGKHIIARKKVGCLVAGIIPSIPDQVQIGFSICHKIDDYDVINGKKRPGFGLTIAEERALKWSCLNVDDVPEVQSIKKHLKKFKGRCQAYYKDKRITNWVERQF